MMKETKNKKAVLLLSGGLDSAVCLADAEKKYKEIYALTFDYSQKAAEAEIKAAQALALHYKIQQKTINLSWLGLISNSALNSEKEIPEPDALQLNDIKSMQKSAMSVWVPNRNALFINIAACFAEAYSCSSIIIGANKEEGQTFPDNSKEFIEAADNMLKYSSNNKIRIDAPLIDLDKNGIVKRGLKLDIPFNLIYSCYTGSEISCGKCESCLRLKQALQNQHRDDIIRNIFGEAVCR